jgi:hypothetical protein
LKKKKQKNFCKLRPASRSTGLHGCRPQWIKVFCFFFSKKKNSVSFLKNLPPARGCNFCRKACIIGPRNLLGMMMKRLILPFLLIGFVLPLAGCVVAPGGGPHRGYCYWHWRRC